MNHRQGVTDIFLVSKSQYLTIQFESNMLLRGFVEDI